MNGGGKDGERRGGKSERLRKTVTCLSVSSLPSLFFSIYFLSEHIYSMFYSDVFLLFFSSDLTPEAESSPQEANPAMLAVKAHDILTALPFMP